MLLIDTPLGAFPAGLLLWLVNGVDVLALLTLPASVSLGQHRAPDWLPLLLQTAVAASGVVVFL